MRIGTGIRHRGLWRYMDCEGLGQMGSSVFAAIVEERVIDDETSLRNGACILC